MYLFILLCPGNRRPGQTRPESWWHQLSFQLVIAHLTMCRTHSVSRNPRDQMQWEETIPLRGLLPVSWIRTDRLVKIPGDIWNTPTDFWQVTISADSGSYWQTWDRLRFLTIYGKIPTDFGPVNIPDDIWKIPTYLGHVKIPDDIWKIPTDLGHVKHPDKIWNMPTDIGHVKIPDNIIMEDTDRLWTG